LAMVIAQLALNRHANGAMWPFNRSQEPVQRVPDLSTEVNALRAAIGDLRLAVATLEQERGLRDTELTNLRTTYALLIKRIGARLHSAVILVANLTCHVESDLAFTRRLGKRR